MSAAVRAPDPGEEIRRGERFAFGANWSRFLARLTKARIEEAGASLGHTLGLTSLAGLHFLDIGCGSGLFSLAARELGAEVHSFDYDPESVWCAGELRRRFRPDDPGWTVEQGSVLDPAYIGGLGGFEIVYSWGVLHHTGAMWRAVEQALRPVAPGGRLWIALYNWQRYLTRWWTWVKRGYHRTPAPIRPAYVVPFFLYDVVAGIAGDSWRGIDPRRRYLGEGRRGMDAWTDAVDWVGGLPFETARREDVIAFLRERGFVLESLQSAGRRHGCNDFLFRRDAASPTRH
jgi:SAM-dependent methyltransferase